MSNTVGFYRSAWLAIAEGGGWWKPQEVIAALPVSIDVQDAHALLWAMAHRHHMLESRGERRHPEYSVSPACKVPRGVVLSEILAAVGGSEAVR